MTSDIKQGWEPSGKVALAAKKQYAVANPFMAKGQDVDHDDALEASLVAAVQADPLLSAAKDMRDVLAELDKWSRELDATSSRDEYGSSPIAAKVRAALSKSRGE